MTASGILNPKDEAASRVMTTFVNLLFDAMEREHPAKSTRIKMSTMKLMQEQKFDKCIYDAFHDGLRKRPVAVPTLPLTERRCRDIVQLSYNVACEVLGPVDADAMFGRAIEAVKRSPTSGSYPITSLL